MTTDSNGVRTETGYTPGGSYTVARMKDGKKSIFATRSVTRFLQLFLGDPPMQEEILEQAEPVTFEHRCAYCTQGFNAGQGCMLDNVKFCRYCRAEYRYFEYFRTRIEKCSDRYIYELKETPL